MATVQYTNINSFRGGGMSVAARIAMKMAVGIQAALYHVTSTDANPQHHLCEDGKESWCGYKREKDTYQHKSVIKEIKKSNQSLIT